MTLLPLYLPGPVAHNSDLVVTGAVGVSEQSQLPPGAGAHSGEGYPSDSAAVSGRKADTLVPSDTAELRDRGA